MKQLLPFFLLFICLYLSSCGESVYDESNNGSRNVVMGVWDSYYPETDSLVLTRVFTDDFYSYFSFSEGKVQNQWNKQHYIIMDDELLLDHYTQTFRIDCDTLWITNSVGDQVTKYIRRKLVVL